MQYRRFGRTNLQMPVLSTGGMRYQDGWKDKPLSEVDAAGQANLEATIARSIELGIHHIETARGYGVSERQLGVVLPHYDRDKLIVQTKIAPEDDADVFVAHFEESLERLQLDHVDLLGVHGINNAELLDQTLRPGGCLAAARELQRQGKCRWVGFSTHAPLHTLLEAINTEAVYQGHAGFDYVNLHWYTIFQRNWPAIQAATRRDMGVFIISPTDKGGMLYQPSDDLVELCDPMHPMVFNDLWTLRRPEVHTLSVGAARPGDFDLHVEAVGRLGEAEALSGSVYRRMCSRMLERCGVEHPEAMSPGLPEPEETPGGVNLEVMLWLRHLAVGWGMMDYAKMRFNLFGSGDHWFPGQPPAEALGAVTDEQLRAAVAGHPYADAIPGLVREAVSLLAGEPVKRLSDG
ncbi:MAG: aldo/keto reductase [Planctomycetota bacterium]